MRGLWIAWVLALLSPTWALAHKPSDSYLSITVGPADIRGQWDIALRDLDFALGLDADGNGEITWGEVRARHADIAVYASARLKLQADDKACTLEVGEQKVDDHTDGTYSVLPLHFTCDTTGAPTRLSLTYTLFADLDPQHRGLLSLLARGTASTAVLGPQAPTQVFKLDEISRWRQFTDYVREGNWHIWVGFDHILFLLSLLLPSVLVWRSKPRDWEAVPGFREALVDVLKIVTAFTLAHSITLSLAVLGVIDLPTRLVESAIALSIILAALNNVRPLVLGRLWMVAFGFGLMHGFGFASVLVDLGLPRDTLALALVGFNVGVELGQLAIVLLFLPFAFALRDTRFYQRWVMLGGSLLITALAAVWFVERAFAVKLQGF